MVQPPDNVAVSELTQSMARVTWNSVSGVLLYHLSVAANNKPGLPPVIRNVTATAVNISNLEPCTTYTIGVASINMFLEPGESNNVTYTTSSKSRRSRTFQSKTFDGNHKAVDLCLDVFWMLLDLHNQDFL